MTERTSTRKLTRWVTVETESAFSSTRKRRQRTRMFVHQDIFYCSLPDCTDRRTVNIDSEYGLCHSHLLATVTAAPQAVSRTLLVDRINAVTDEAAARRDTLRETQRRSQAMRTAGWIYYIKVHDLIKIGYASVLEDRLRQYPPNITLLAIHPGTRELETHLHRKFRLHLKQGREWYDDAHVIRDHINAVATEHGTPASQQPWLSGTAWVTDTAA